MLGITSIYLGRSRFAQDQRDIEKYAVMISTEGIGAGSVTVRNWQFSLSFDELVENLTEITRIYIINHYEQTYRKKKIVSGWDADVKRLHYQSSPVPGLESVDPIAEQELEKILKAANLGQGTKGRAIIEIMGLQQDTIKPE